jgi:hypothetical protein
MVHNIAGIPEEGPINRIPRDPMMQFFAYAHIPESLRATSELFYNLAATIVDQIPRNPERTVALRKLLEAKDCAVRAMLYRDEPG